MVCHWTNRPQVLPMLFQRGPRRQSIARCHLILARPHAQTSAGFFELTRLLLRLDHVARITVNASFTGDGELSINAIPQTLVVCVVTYF